MTRLEALVDVVTRRDSSMAWSPDPIFGPMSGAAWLRLGYPHLDHHLRQVGT